MRVGILNFFLFFQKIFLHQQVCENFFQNCRWYARNSKNSRMLMMNVDTKPKIATASLQGISVSLPSENGQDPHRFAGGACCCFWSSACK
jgi:hypothetical protein